jgi:hypothetical protein
MAEGPLGHQDGTPQAPDGEAGAQAEIFQCRLGGRRWYCKQSGLNLQHGRRRTILAIGCKRYRGGRMRNGHHNMMTGLRRPWATIVLLLATFVAVFVTTPCDSHPYFSTTDTRLRLQSVDP